VFQKIHTLRASKDSLTDQKFHRTDNEVQPTAPTGTRSEITATAEFSMLLI